jgi:phosphomannomutase
MQTNSLYQKWLDSPRLTSKEKSQLASLSEQEIALYFSEKPLLYGTAGVRAKMGLGTQRLNRFTYAQLAYGYGRYVRNTFGVNATIIIGHDNRLNSDSFAYLCAQVLSSLGINVLLFGRNRLMPTPIVSYAIRTVKASGGIIITASHNPSEYNGFKAYNPDGGQVLPKVAKKIEDYTPGASELLNINYATQNNRINYLSNHMVCKRYFEDATTALVNPVSTVFKKPYPVVFTGHHGTTVKLIPRFLAKLRYHIKPVKKQSFYSPTFVNSPCANPEDPESFALAIKYAEKVHSNIIIGVDPDGDRMAIMIKHDNQWRLMSGNEMGIIYTHYVLKHKRYTSIPYVIASYVSNNLVDRIVAKKGGKVYRTGTGFK